MCVCVRVLVCRYELSLCSPGWPETHNFYHSNWQHDPGKMESNTRSTKVSGNSQLYLEHQTFYILRFKRGHTSKGHVSLGCMQSQGEPALGNIIRVNPIDDGESEINLLLFTVSGRGTKARSKNIVPCHKRSHDYCFLGVFSHSQNSPHTAPSMDCVPTMLILPQLCWHWCPGVLFCVVSVFETGSGCVAQTHPHTGVPPHLEYWGYMCGSHTLTGMLGVFYWRVQWL